MAIQIIGHLNGLITKQQTSSNTFLIVSDRGSSWLHVPVTMIYCTTAVLYIIATVNNASYV